MGNCLGKAAGGRSTGERERVWRKKNDQGRHECEVFGSGPESTESAHAWNSCSKNPGHPHFIPAPDFCLDHLPEGCQKLPALQYVRTVSALTVRLRVSYTSPRRPQGYTFSKDRGSTLLHMGSGWVYAILPGTDTCECHACKGSHSPRQRWYMYKIFIDTACHVVYNSEEAWHTKVDFFYDDERSSLEGKVRTALGSEVISRNKKGDWCRLVCVTHDGYLAAKLHRHLLEREEVWKCFRGENRETNGWDKLCVVVSHPHGKPKQVTVGEVKGMGLVERHQKKFFYSTDTCPGSSGAPVLVLDDFGMVNDVISVGDQTWTSPHSEGGAGEGFNSSGTSSLSLKVRQMIGPLFSYREYHGYREGLPNYGG